MDAFVRSDLAMECGCQDGEKGIGVTETTVDGCRLLRVQIRSEQVAKRIGKPMGHYVTVECGALCLLDDRELERVARVIGVELRSMAERLCGQRISARSSALVVGMGNRRSTVDSVGPETVSRLSVTRHLDRMDGALFSTVGLCKISAVEPGVPAVTGLETAETVQGIVTAIRPDLVVAVDALTARSPERLGATVQISDGGIRPASGVGRGHCVLDRDALGVPVISLGVPTAVSCDTLAYDLLCRAGVTASKEIRSALSLGKTHLVAPSEIDLLVQTAGVLLANAIERAFAVS